MTTNNARQAAEQIIATYDSHDQIWAVADRGCGEWELDRAAELADESTVSEILAAIEELCRERCE